MRIALRLVDSDDSAERLETVWRGPATQPTRPTSCSPPASSPLQVAWEDMGYSAERRRIMAEQMDTDPAARLSRLLDELPSEPAATGAET